MSWEDKEKELEEAITRMGIAAGFKPLIAKINALLFLAPGEVCMDYLVEKTGYSLASVSMGIKQLEFMKRIRRTKHPGSKKVYVSSEKNIVTMIYDHLKMMRETTFKQTKELLTPVLFMYEQEVKKKALKKEERMVLQEKIRWYHSYVEQSKVIQDLFAKYEDDFKEKAMEYQSL